MTIWRYHCSLCSHYSYLQQFAKSIFCLKIFFSFSGFPMTSLVPSSSPARALVGFQILFVSVHGVRQFHRYAELQKNLSNRFMKRNRNRILKKLQERGHGDFCFAVDDTANPKYRVIGFWLCKVPVLHLVPSYGAKVLVLVIVDLKTRQALPISYAFLTGKKSKSPLRSLQSARFDRRGAPRRLSTAACGR